jgi:hypothetical protein
MGRARARFFRPPPREQNVSIEGEVWSEQPLERVEVVLSAS